MVGIGNPLGRALRRAGERTVRRYARRAVMNAARQMAQKSGMQVPGQTLRSRAYPGDFTGRPRLTYAPNQDGIPDPGEVVWTWVPYEDDHSRGKDRPVLLIGSDGKWLLGLQMTSQDHDRDAAQEASAGRYWMDIGSGDWDNQGRPSEVRLNRIIRIDPEGVRRTAARLDRDRFDRVAAGVRKHY